MNASVHGEIVNIWYHSYVHQYTKVHISEPLIIQDFLSIKKNSFLPLSNFRIHTIVYRNSGLKKKKKLPEFSRASVQHGE